jgi:hypothetical protein
MNPPAFTGPCDAQHQAMNIVHVELDLAGSIGFLQFATPKFFAIANHNELDRALGILVFIVNSSQS